MFDKKHFFVIGIWIPSRILVHCSPWAPFTLVGNDTSLRDYREFRKTPAFLSQLTDSMLALSTYALSHISRVGRL